MPHGFSLKNNNEISEKCLILFKIKPPAGRAYAPEGKAKILTAPEEYALYSTGQAGIHLVFRGLKFDPDARIGQKEAFFKDFIIGGAT
jgi:hypothetical protein